MTFASWTKDRPMVPTFDYPLPDDVGLPHEVKSFEVKRGGLHVAQKCKFCAKDATKYVLHSEGMAYVPACPDHLDKAKDAAARCTPDKSYDASNIDRIGDLPQRKGYAWDTEAPHNWGYDHVATAAGAAHYHAPIGTPIKKHTVDPKLKAALGSLHDAGDGLDTPSNAFGMTYQHKVAQHPLIKDAKARDWSRVPTTDYTPPPGLVATEEKLKSAPIRKVFDGAPFRSGYDPQILRTDGGDVVIDGHHRVAMHAGVGDTHYGAKVLDLRGGKSIDKAFADIEAQRKADEAAREAKMDADAQQIAERMVKQATAAEPHVTPVIQSAVEAHGGYMEGLEHRLKTVDSTKRKILTKARRKHTDAYGGSSGISDVLRYTAVIPTDDYTDGVQATLDALAAAGFRPTISNNYWPKGDAYSGLNLLLAGKGQDLEVQFHTPESAAAKEANHDDYDIARDPDRSLEDRMAAWNRMVPRWDEVPQPDGWLDFGGLFLYDPPDGNGRGRYVNRWEAQGLPTPPREKHTQQWGEGYDLDEADPDAPDLFAPFKHFSFAGKFPWSKKKGRH